MSLAIVRQYLLTKLREAAGDMVVIQEGENYQPEGTQDYPFARFQILPRESVLRDISSAYTMQEAGLAAITLYFTRSTNSVTDALVLAEMIKAVFPVQNTVLDNGNQLLITAAWVEAVRHDDDGFFVPLFVRWSNLA